MGLKRESAFIELASEIATGLFVGGFGIIHHRFSIDFDGHVISLHDDMLRPPLIVLRRWLADIDHVIEAARLFPIRVGVVDLRLKPVFWPATWLVSCMEINAAVGTRLSHHVCFQFKVFERFWIADIKKMAAFAARNQRSILDFPSVAVFCCGLPTAEGFAVENRDEALFVRRGETNNGS